MLDILFYVIFVVSFFTLLSMADISLYIVFVLLFAIFLLYRKGLFSRRKRLIKFIIKNKTFMKREEVKFCSWGGRFKYTTPNEKFRLYETYNLSNIRYHIYKRCEKTDEYNFVGTWTYNEYDVLSEIRDVQFNPSFNVEELKNCF